MSNTIGIADFRAIINRTITRYEDSAVPTIGRYAFYGCADLTEVDCPSATSLGTNALQGCSSLSSVNLPKVRTVGDYVFYGCSSLTRLDLPDATMIEGDSFERSGLRTLVIGTNRTSVCECNSSFRRPSSLQEIYVPDDLVASYKSAYGWSAVSAYIFPVSQAPDA